MAPATAAGSARALSAVASSLGAVPGWLLLGVTAVVVVPVALVAVLVLLLADAPVRRFERIVAALRGGPDGR